MSSTTARVTPYLLNKYNLLKTVKRKIDENLPSNVKFQREVQAATYCLDYSPLTFLDDQANEYDNKFVQGIRTRENEYTSKLFTEKSDADLGVIRLGSLKTLYY